MYLVNGNYKGLFKPGEDISYFLCGCRVPHYDNPRETLVMAKRLFQDVQKLFINDEMVMAELKETILGEAYYNAVLWTGNGRLSSIPDAETYFHELRKLVRRYEKKGFVFKDYAELVAAIFEEES